MSTRAALALGSNLGDRLATLQTAAADLLAPAENTLVAASSVYETDPVGGPEQGQYLNAVLVIQTALDASGLLALAQATEARGGRERRVRWGARTIDVDVLSFGDEVSDDPDLTLPHPRADQRAFVLVPWAEADRHYVVPRLGATVDELLGRLPDSSGVHKVAAPEALLSLAASR
jgi:2-amino-4-hydroxy-6-hydroxymethyldihydropteridine diphosphokinase